jgi:hypothetical protein
MSIFKIVSVQGKVSKIRNTIDVSGGGENSSASTSHISIFNIDNQTIRYSAPFTSVINNGNEIVVSGVIWRGVLQALAYKNFSTGTYDNVGIFKNFFIGFIFFIIGLFTLTMGIGIIFAIFGLLSIVSGFYIKKAFTNVKNTQKEENNV